MPVYDHNSEQIGHVIRIHITDNNPVKKRGQNSLAAQARNKEWLRLIGNIAEPDDPYALSMAQDFWEQGFIKIRGEGLLWLQQYILPSQIARIEENGIYLSNWG